MGENNKQNKLMAAEDICDKCTLGKQNRCAHAYYYHCDCWGKCLDTPEYCPNKNLVGGNV